MNNRNPNKQALVKNSWQESASLQEQRAVLYIKQLYGDMLDRSGKLKYLHLLDVRAQVPEGFSEDAKVAAILHDIKEDHKVSNKDLLEKGFSPRTVELVDIVTNPDKGQPYGNFVNGVIATKDIEAITLKDRDMACNMSHERNKDLTFEGRVNIYRKYKDEKPKLEKAIEHLKPEYLSQETINKRLENNR